MPEVPVFPFFLGCGRSGTTLVWEMFDAHPDLAMAPEHYFPAAPPNGWQRPDGSLNAGHAVERMVQAPWFERFGLEPDALRERARGRDVRSYADLVRCLYGAYADSKGKSRFGNKTPNHVMTIPQLGELFPEGRFVHIVRDGHDVALSYLDKNFGPDDIRSAAWFWRERVERGRAGGAVVGQARYREVHYEALIDDPAGELAGLCAFLDLPYEAAMLRYHERAPDPTIRRDPQGHLVKPPTKGLRDWRGQMSRSDTVRFESIAGETLEAFGYERSGLKPSLADRAGMLSADAAAGMRRATHRAHAGSASATRRFRHA